MLVHKDKHQSRSQEPVAGTGIDPQVKSPSPPRRRGPSDFRSDAKAKALDSRARERQNSLTLGGLAWTLADLIEWIAASLVLSDMTACEIAPPSIGCGDGQPEGCRTAFFDGRDWLVKPLQHWASRPAQHSALTSTLSLGARPRNSRFMA